MTIQQKIKFIQQAYHLLDTKKGYSQSKVVTKLKRLGYDTTKPTFNKIINDNDLGKATIIMVAQGMIDLIKKELCLEYTVEGEWEALENCRPEVVSTKVENDNRKGLVIHAEGRLEIAEKVDFFVSAEEEILEFGITLNSFSSYVLSRKPREFKTPLLELLKKGVHLKCYLMDPDWNGTRIYFDDRAKTLNEGINGIEKIRTSLRKLKIFSKELESLNYQGTFEVFKYRHFPNNYFLIVDKKQRLKTKMMVSNYLFGQQRASCPVLEFSRLDQPILFNRYLESFEKIISEAKKVNFAEVED